MLLGFKKQDSEFPDISLQCARVLMRPPTLTDWPEWVKVRAVNQDHIQPFEPLWPSEPFTQDLFKRRLARQIREWELGHANAFLIFKRDNGQLIGGMNINNICRGAAQYASLGYWIDWNHEGRGYMAESLALTLRYCFETLGLHRVNASCLAHNTRSRNVLVKAGFQEEGMAEKYLQINGEWQDHILFGLPIEHWKEVEGGD
ncbi:MAG TPA: GNAT family protein [Alphaproteobacteria bacterium]|nr:GNAT family N-acetyltransferase [Alphaproteobacteria bacterium]USO04987.1 MAG: GNAT family N-acetyltransferase [Rhodospirillales bacterium]HOO82359.1 GNAT family protein [Alphaproteobacteria bacterium]